MHPPSFWQIVVIAILLLIFFGGRGKLSGAMKDLAEGIKGFRKGLSDEDKAAAANAAQNEAATKAEAPRLIADKSSTTTTGRRSPADVP
jgi:sec-independent protein translocase protein TatA